MERTLAVKRSLGAKILQQIRTVNFKDQPAVRMMITWDNHTPIQIQMYLGFIRLPKPVPTEDTAK
jgi:hypothetical protein